MLSIFFFQMFLIIHAQSYCLWQKLETNVNKQYTKRNFLILSVYNNNLFSLVPVFVLFDLQHVLRNYVLNILIL